MKIHTRASNCASPEISDDIIKGKINILIKKENKYQLMKIFF